jgi:hypothetical protein
MLGGAYFAALQGQELSISAKLHSLMKGKGHERGGILTKVSEAEQEFSFLIWIKWTTYYDGGGLEKLPRHAHA